MATLDDTAKSLISKSYPQVKDMENDPIKASSAVFESADVCTNAYRQIMLPF